MISRVSRDSQDHPSRSDETIRYGRDGYLIRDPSDLHLKVEVGSSDDSCQNGRTNEQRSMEHEGSEEPEIGHNREGPRSS